ncbi:MAG: glycosyltransferase [Marinoscillum sp.]|uniref:glycosyltransferase family 2 protein n=1 Tax=Marinoscillum sp. TaxID=2024838 RepID=UPI0032F8418F
MMVSVLIPCFNAERFIRQSIGSILDQSYQDFEVIVLDDASTDSSLKVIRSFSDPRIRVLVNPSNLGYLKTMNRLFGEAKGNLIAFQDADDVSNEKRLETQVAFLEQYPSVSIVGTNYDLIDENDLCLGTYSVSEGRDQLKELIPYRNIFQKPSIMFRNEVYAKVGGYREAFLDLKNISEDYDWLLRASHHFEFGNINHSPALYQYRSVTTAMTKDFDHPEQLFGEKIAQFLYKERLQRGSDSMSEGNYKPIFDFIEELKKPYLLDPSRFYRERAEALMYHGLKKKAISSALKAFGARKSFKNLRLVQYCIRKTIFTL